MWILDVGHEPIDGYRLVKFLGAGGYGEVWEAEAPGNFRIALKFVDLDQEKSANELRSLELMQKIRHPNLVDIQFVRQVNDCAVLAMPLCDRSLYDRFKECLGINLPGLPPEELLHYMAETAKAIDFLNTATLPGAAEKMVGIQHRDIKPHNILIVGDSVRLADFGLAKILERRVASHTGSLTPHYASPEMLTGTVAESTDQYSLAVTYYQMRCGRLPFEGNVHRVMQGHIRQLPDLKYLPAEEHRTLFRALAKRPSRRFPTCRHFVRELIQNVSIAERQRSKLLGQVKLTEEEENRTLDQESLPDISDETTIRSSRPPAPPDPDIESPDELPTD